MVSDHSTKYLTHQIKRGQKNIDSVFKQKSDESSDVEGHFVSPNLDIQVNEAFSCVEDCNRLFRDRKESQRRIREYYLKIS